MRNELKLKRITYSILFLTKKLKGEKIMKSDNNTLKLVIKVNQKKLEREKHFEENKQKVLNAFGGKYHIRLTTLQISNLTKLSRSVVYSCLQILKKEKYVKKLNAYKTNRYQMYFLTSPKRELTEEVEFSTRMKCYHEEHEKLLEYIFNLLKFGIQLPIVTNLLNIGSLITASHYRDELINKGRIIQKFNTENRLEIQYITKDDLKKKIEYENQLVLSSMSNCKSMKELCEKTGLKDLKPIMRRLVTLGKLNETRNLDNSLSWSIISKPNSTQLTV